MSTSNDKIWFQKLRINSWEIEILIVACILAFLFNVPDFISDMIAANFVSDHYDMRSENKNGFWRNLGFFKYLFFRGISYLMSIAKVTFSAYIFCRGFWVAALGLSSVFPNGIDIERLNFSSYFNEILSKSHIDKFILRLDNICSSIFSLGFLIGLFFVSFLPFWALTFLLGNLLYPFPSLIVPITGFFAISGAIFFIDLFFFGILKKIKWRFFSYPYSKLYSFFRIITLFFIYEPIYYLLVSNTKKRFVLLFGLITIFSFDIYFRDTFFEKIIRSDGYIGTTLGNSLDKSTSSMFSSYYEDKMQNSKINISYRSYPFINSDIISESYLKLYIPFQPKMHASIDSACANINSDFNSKSDLIKCINSQYAIYIDNDTIENDFIMNGYNLNGNGLSTFFMPVSLKKYLDGRHTITIEKLFYERAWYRSNKDSTKVDFLNEDSHLVLLKAHDSIIHIPFYIYR